MTVETLADAFQLGWRIRVKCDTRGDNWRAAHRDPAIACHSAHELDLKTLVWTRGALHINDLKDRLKCPACGSRHILVFFEVPNQPAALAARAHIDLEEYLDDAEAGTLSPTDALA